MVSSPTSTWLVISALAISAFLPCRAAAQQPAETAIPDKVSLFIPYKDYTQEDNKRLLEMYK